MKKAILLSICLLFSPNKARADLFGGDVVVLTQILAKSVQQLLQLRQILTTSRQELRAFQNIHQGISTAITNFNQLDISDFKGALSDLSSMEEALSELKKRYGDLDFTSPLNEELRATDSLAAEGLFRADSSFDLSLDLSRIANSIESKSRAASPKGAQKLSAQGISLLLQAATEDLRINNTRMKITAHETAKRNAAEKIKSKAILAGTKNLSQKLKSSKTHFSLPDLSQRK